MGLMFVYFIFLAFLFIFCRAPPLPTYVPFLHLSLQPISFDAFETELCGNITVFLFYLLPCPSPLPTVFAFAFAAHLFRRADHRRGPADGGGQRREAASGVPAPLRLQLPHHPREGEIH